LTPRSRGYQLEVDPSAVDLHQFRAMMPPDWPRRRAREVFVEIYDGLVR
jgi:hypothetical protein